MPRKIMLFVLVLLITGCSANPAPAPTAVAPTPAPTFTPLPTYTPNPTYTPLPTYTPFPTLTPTALPPTPTALPTATATVLPTPTPVTHVVEAGDTLTILALKYGVSLDALTGANAIQDTDVIEVGQTLVIPLGPTAEASGTLTLTATALPVVRAAPPTPAPAVKPGFVYPAPKLLKPANGTNFMYNARNENGGVDGITFEWASAGKLENGTQECRFARLPNGDIGLMYDRYQIEFDPPLASVNSGRQSIFNNDHGLVKSFYLLEFRHAIPYTWRVVVVRWCVPKFNKKAPAGSLGQVSPYSEPMTFSYSH